MKYLLIPAYVIISCMLFNSCSEKEELCSTGTYDYTLTRSEPFECFSDNYIQLRDNSFQQYGSSNALYYYYKTDNSFFVFDAYLNDESSNYTYDALRLKLLDINNLEIVNEDVLSIHSIQGATVLKNHNFWIISTDHTPYYPELLKINTSGEKVISKSLRYDGTDRVASSSLTGTNDFGCLIGFQSTNSNQWFVKRYDKNGKSIWRCDLPLVGFINKSIQCNNDEIIVCCNVYDDFDFSHAALYKISKDGEYLLKTILPDLSVMHSIDMSEIRGMIELPDNNLLLKVGSRSLVKIDKQGNVIWTLQNVYDVVAKVTEEDKLVISYRKFKNLNDTDIALAGISDDGTIEWENTYGGTGDEHVIDFFELPGEGFFIFGKSFNFTGEWFTIHYPEMDCYEYSPEIIESDYFIKTDMLGQTCN